MLYIISFKIKTRTFKQAKATCPAAQHDANNEVQKMEAGATGLHSLDRYQYDTHECVILKADSICCNLQNRVLICFQFVYKQEQLTNKAAPAAETKTPTILRRLVVSDLMTIAITSVKMGVIG